MWQKNLLIAIAGLFVAVPLAAQEDQFRVPTVIEDDDDAPAESDAPAERVEDDDSPEYEDDLDDFVPSEEVPPDEQLTFPVDI